MLKVILPVLVAFLVLVAINWYVHDRTNPIRPPTDIGQELRDLLPNPNAVDYKAHFLIFTHQTQRDFSDEKYHNRSMDVFLTDTNPFTIHVKKKGTTWEHFFATLPMKLTASCLTTGDGQIFCDGKNGSLSFYLNGNFEANLLQRVIQDGDRALINYGLDSEEEIKKKLDKLNEVSRGL